MKKIVLTLLTMATAAASMPQENGTIVGRILYADGTPAIGVRVVAVAAGDPQRSEPLFIQVLKHVSRTDGDGKFRFEKVATGRYYVATGSENYSQGSVKGRSGFSISEPYYFPGVRGQPNAGLIDVGVGAMREVEFRLETEATPPAPSFKVSGRVSMDDLARLTRNDAGYVRVILTLLGARPACGGPRPPFVGNVGPDGKFELRNIPPDSYAACVQFFGGDYGAGSRPSKLDVNADVTDLLFDRNVLFVKGQPASPLP